MITLHVLQLLANNDLGTMGESLFWEEMPIDGVGVGILSRGGPMLRSNLASQSFDLYARGANNPAGGQLLEKIWEFLAAKEFIVALPEVTDGEVKSTKSYTRVNVIPQGNIENIGKDETNRIVWRSSWQLNYVKE